MGKTGIFREIDKLGRIVIPMEIRKTLSINEGDALEFVLDDDKIVLRKKHTSCFFCNSDVNLAKFEDKYICEGCVNKIKRFY